MPVKQKQGKKKKQKKRKLDNPFGIVLEDISLGDNTDSLVMDLGLYQVELGLDFVRAGVGAEFEFFGSEASADAGISFDKEGGVQFDAGFNVEGIGDIEIVADDECNGSVTLTGLDGWLVHQIPFEVPGCKEEEEEEQYGDDEERQPDWDEDWGEDENKEDTDSPHHIEGEPAEFVAVGVAECIYSYVEGQSWNSATEITYSDTSNFKRLTSIGSFKPDGVDGTITLRESESSVKTASIGSFPLSLSTNLNYNNFSDEWQREWGVLPEDKGQTGRVFDHFFRRMSFVDARSSIDAQFYLTPRTWRYSASITASVTPLKRPGDWTEQDWKSHPNWAYEQAYGSPPSDTYERASSLDNRGYGSGRRSGIWTQIGSGFWWATGTRQIINKELEGRFRDKTIEKSSRGSFRVGGTDYERRYRSYWRSQYKITVYKFDRNKPPPPSGNPPMKKDKCCKAIKRELLEIKKMVAEMHEVMDPVNLKDDSYVPKRYRMHGATGKTKIETYPELFKELFLLIDRDAFIPFSVFVKDTNAAIAGNQSKSTDYKTLSHALKAILETLEETAGDIDVGTGIMVRLAYAVSSIQQALAKTLDISINIETFLGYAVKTVTSIVPLSFNPIKGKRGQIDLNKEKSTEKVLPALLKHHDQAYRTTKIDVARTKRLPESIVEILNAARTPEDGERIG